jgi:hypothetical protein
VELLIEDSLKPDKPKDVDENSVVRLLVEVCTAASVVLI